MVCDLPLSLQVPSSFSQTQVNLVITLLPQPTGDQGERTASRRQLMCAGT